MGRGTKHKHEWKPTTLETAIHARKLYVHSAHIMANENVFKRTQDFASATLWKIHEITLNIYLKVWTANRINAARHPDRAAHRLALQGEALEQCRTLLALIEMTRSQFQLREKKFWNWVNMTHQLGLRLNAWYKSDLSRYGGTSQNGTQPTSVEAVVG